MSITTGRPRKEREIQPEEPGRAHANNGVKRHRRIGFAQDRESLPRICRFIAARARAKRVAVALAADGGIHLAIDSIEWLVQHATHKVVGVYHRPTSWLDIYDDIRAQAGTRD